MQSVITWFAGLLLAGTALLAGDIHAGGLELSFDEQTGGLTNLFYPSTGVVLSAPPESAGLLDVAYPVELFSPMRLASRFSKARIVRERKAVRITWDGLGPSHANCPLPAGKVVASVTLRPADDGRSMILSCRIENRSAAPIPQILFPDLHGLKPFAGAELTQLRFARGVVAPFRDPIQPPGAAPFYIDRGWKSYSAGGYYSEFALRWLDYGGLRGGLSLFQKKWGADDFPGIRTQRTERDPLSLRLVWEHRVSIPPGGSWESGEFWMTPHSGGWAKGIEVYRDYVRQVNPPRELPRRVREGLGFQTIWMLQALDNDPSDAAFRFRDIPGVARDALIHGIDEVVPWGWCTYFSLPIPLREELGSRAEFLGAIRQARELGVDVAPFVSVATLRNEYASRYGAKPGSGNWTYHPELIPNFRPYYSKAFDGAWVGTGNVRWQSDVEAALTGWIDAGMSSISWDQFTSPGVPFFRRIRGLARAKDAQSTFSGESTSAASFEHDGAVLDFTWNWVDYVDAGPLLNVLRAPRLNCNVEDSPLVAKQAFIDGLYLNVMPRKRDAPNGTALISSQPALAAALKQAARLRHRFLAYFTGGVFLGDSLLREPAPAFVRAHQLGNKLLIFVLNDQPRAQNVVLRTDLEPWLNGARYEVRSYDADGNLIAATHSRGHLWTGTTPRLEPLDIAIFEVAGQ